MSELVELTVAEAGRLLGQRSIGVQELVEATLARIDETEPTLHAYAHIADAALAQAAKLDDELATGGRRGPLHGIPVAVKDVFHTGDMPTEAGSRSLAGFRPREDATAVSRLRKAGAIIVGKTVTHELAYGQNVPPTRNAWDHTCYPGGSSAGSGVAVSARSAFAALGTDTAGSVRIPASLSGVVGMKPTYGLVSDDGVIPLSRSLDHVGALTRTVEDCQLVLDAITGSATHLRADDNGCDGIVLGVERDYFFGDHVDWEVRIAVEAVLDELASHGATVIEVSLPHLRLMPAVALTVLLVEATDYHRSSLRKRPFDYEPGTRLMLELGELVPATLYSTARRARVLLQSSMKSIFERCRLDALVVPTTPQTTVPLDDLSVDLVPKEGAQMTLAAYVESCVPANLTGQPALSVPCGFNSHGLPIGFQLIGRPFHETDLFRIAGVYERGHCWHSFSPKIHSASA
jgi:aspartyl-tRNA(Asn)/glutamyl-tRNA(Gln) amidotransferase subunit A